MKSVPDPKILLSVTAVYMMQTYHHLK